MLKRLTTGLDLQIFVKPLQSVTFIFPPDDSEENEEFFFVHVAVTLIVGSKPRRIKSVSVELESEALLRVPGQQVFREKIHYQVIEIAEVKDKILVPGKHKFQLAFKVPQTIAPYEQTLFGNVEQKLSATCSGDFASSPLKSTVPIYMLLYPCGKGEIAAELNLNKVAFNEHLGVYRIETASPMYTQSAIYRIRFSFEGAPRSASIRSISATLVQSYRLKSLMSDGVDLEPKATMIPLFHWSPSSSPTGLEYEPEALVLRGRDYVAALPPNRGFKVSYYGRNSGHRQLRPSTHYLTLSPITITHRLRFYIVFTYMDSEGQEIKQQIKHDFEVTVFTCYCNQDKVELPKYRLDATGKKIDGDEVLEQDCTCENPLDYLEANSTDWNLEWFRKTARRPSHSDQPRGQRPKV